MGYAYRVPEYKILSASDVEVITETSLRILENIGLKVPNQKILELASGRGAVVDQEREIVKFPEKLVMESVGSAGKKHILYGRDRDKRAEFGYHMFNFNGSSGQYQIVEEKSLKRRRPTREDLKDAIRIGEALENINVVGAMVVPSDVSPEVADVITFNELLVSTTKPFTGWIFNGDSARAIIEMMEVAAGSREELKKYPFYEVFIEPISPLAFRKEGLDILLRFVEAGLPVGISPMVQVGATGPCSLSGALAQENAEILAGVIITQLINPGHPVTYGGIPHIFDMREGLISFGAPEQAIMAAAITQIGRSYGFPVYNNTGLSDSKLIDAQFGIECAASLSLGALAQADIFGHLGICGADNAASLIQLIIDNETAGYFIRLLSGLEVSRESVGYGEIEREGIGGNFLGNDLTLMNFRREFWFPALFDRASWDAWEQRGKKDLVTRAMEKKEEILKKHEPPPLDDRVSRELRKISGSYTRTP